MNKDTAVTQYGLNATNQVTPEGTLTYKQIGTWEDGTPRFEATTAYSPEQQAIYDQSSQNELQIGQIAGQQIGRVGDVFGSPVDLSNETTEARLMELGRERLDPVLADRKQALEQDLINRGIRPGTRAYDAQMTNFNQGSNDAYNQLLLSGRGQAVQEALTERNQPINEITALMSGSQVSQPGFTSTPQAGVAPVDYTGLVNQQYQSQLASSNAKMGAIAGMAGTLGGWALSDPRLKRGAIKVADDPRGFGRWVFRYVGDDNVQSGVMADELKKVRPQAVVTTKSGYDMVDYGAL